VSPGEYVDSSDQSKCVLTQIFEGYLDMTDVYNKPDIKNVKYGRHFIHGQFCQVGYIWPRFKNDPLLFGTGIRYDLTGTDAVSETIGTWNILPPSTDQ
jgi:hypothetical protein